MGLLDNLPPPTVAAPITPNSQPGSSLAPQLAQPAPPIDPGDDFNQRLANAIGVFAIDGDGLAKGLLFQLEQAAQSYEAASLPQDRQHWHEFAVRTLATLATLGAAGRAERFEHDHDRINSLSEHLDGLGIHLTELSDAFNKRCVQIDDLDSRLVTVGSDLEDVKHAADKPASKPEAKDS